METPALPNQPAPFNPNRPLVAGPNQVPGQPGQQPRPGMAPDRNQVAPAPKDPQVLALVGMYAHQLGSTNPVDVTMALSSLEALGPAYRADVNAAVIAHLRPGTNPMALGELTDYCIRNQVKEAAGNLQFLTTDADAAVRASASGAYSQIMAVHPGNQVGNPQGVAPGYAPAPGGAPAGAAGPAPRANYPGAVTPDLVGYLEALKSYDGRAPGTAVQIAKMPTAQMLAIVSAAYDDPNMHTKTLQLLTAILCKRVREPGVVDQLRRVMTSEALSLSWEDRTRAAVAMVHFGTPQDLKAILTMLGSHQGMSVEMKKVLIDTMASKPAMLATPATTMMLQTIMNDRNSWVAGVAAAHALSITPTPAARDALGSSIIIRTVSYNDETRIWVLNWLAKHKPPYSPQTIANLRAVAGEKNAPEVAKVAKALLKKAGG